LAVDISFTAHNIRLDDGTTTRPGDGLQMDAHPWFLSARRILNAVFPGDKGRFRLVDLGCLEGGYSVEFARMGFQVLGLEVRDSNFAACRYVKERTRLPNLEFVQDNAWNVQAYGPFDAVFCCGLLYHLDRPKRFLEILSSVTRRVLILQTHFSTEDRNRKHGLSSLDENESLPGRWYKEFRSDEAFQRRDSSRWAAWDNRRSFWIRREYLIQAIRDVGFDLVAEQFDGLGQDIAGSLTVGYYRTDERGTFVGIKSDP
jgi:hypothetical protein